MRFAETLSKYGLEAIDAQLQAYRDECEKRRETHPHYEDVPANLALRGTPEFEQGRKFTSSVDCGRFARED